jgi:hypothetical protein
VARATTSGQPGDTVTIATTNLTHLGTFPGVHAQLWNLIAGGDGREIDSESD